MTFNAEITAPEAGRQITQWTRNIYNSSIGLRDKSAAGPVQAQALLGQMRQCHEAWTSINSVKATAGLDQYYKDIYDNQLYDYATELDAQLVAMQDIGTTIRNAFPLSPNGYLERETFIEDPPLTEDRSIPSAALGPLRDSIDAYLALVTVTLTI